LIRSLFWATELFVSALDISKRKIKIKKLKIKSKFELLLIDKNLLNKFLMEY
jgi:hypothetical protein